MRVLGAVLVVTMAATSGCTSVKLVQRDGCWVKRTEQWPKRVQEELGPCAREQRGPWSDDRLVRLVQECIASSDGRWHAQALLAWTRKEPQPERPDDESVLQACLTESAHAVVTDNETLRQRLADVSKDRDVLRTRGDAEQRRLLATQDKLATFLGEAAKKASPPATATAYAASDGKARTETPAAAPAPIALFANGLPPPACAPGVAPPVAAAPAAPSSPVVEATDPAPATPKEPARRARTPRPSKSRDASPASPAAPSCPAPGEPAGVTGGNGTVTPTVAPASRDDSTSR
jgi:hypothetical protein